MAAAGDVNGDGYGDLLIGAQERVYLLLGQAVPVWNTGDLDTYAAAILATNASNPSIATIGDVNDDQLADFAVGDNNTVYLFTGQATWTANAAEPIALTDATATFNSSNNNPTIISLEDANGDGVADFAYQNGGAPTLVFGDVTESWTTQTVPSFSPLQWLFGECGRC